MLRGLMLYFQLQMYVEVAEDFDQSLVLLLVYHEQLVKRVPVQLEFWLSELQ